MEIGPCSERGVFIEQEVSHDFSFCNGLYFCLMNIPHQRDNDNTRPYYGPEKNIELGSLYTFISFRIQFYLTFLLKSVHSLQLTIMPYFVPRISTHYLSLELKPLLPKKFHAHLHRFPVIQYPCVVLDLLQRNIQFQRRSVGTL
jgi:hypothetical protein